MVSICLGKGRETGRDGTGFGGEVKLFYRILVDAYYVFVKTCRTLKHIE